MNGLIRQNGMKFLVIFQLDYGGPMLTDLTKLSE
jgi:hypothetical protein